MSKIRALIIDDSPLARQVLTTALRRDPQIEVVGVASDARFGREKLERLEVDVVTLDLELPEIDGLAFLRAMLAVRPLPVVVVSAFTPKGSHLALRALEIGAVDVMSKPERSLEEIGEVFAIELIDKVKAAAKAGVRRRQRTSGLIRATLPAFPALPALPARRGAARGEPIILLGASTGGCEALPRILADLPADAPPIVCVQHIPAVFSRSFAERLDGIGGLRACEARSGDVLESGRVYVAPGGKHLLLGGGSRPILEVRDGPLVNRYRPSIDLAFRSAAERLGPRVLAAILTGMGDDGVEGLRAIQEAGGFTLAQDQATSIVYGMPREAHRRGAAQVIAPLESIASILLSEVRRRRYS